jgi:predicted RNA binding protein YcfA (HicA-like mRNA interferase family)
VRVDYSVVSDQPTRKVTKMLREAGWAAGESVGSHTKWLGPNGTTFSLPDGHRQISPGVFRNLTKAMRKDRER